MHEARTSRDARLQQSPLLLGEMLLLLVPRTPPALILQKRQPILEILAHHKHIHVRVCVSVSLCVSVCVCVCRCVSVCVPLGLTHSLTHTHTLSLSLSVQRMKQSTCRNHTKQKLLPIPSSSAAVA